MANVFWDLGFVVFTLKNLLLRRPNERAHFAAADIWTTAASTPAGRLTAFGDVRGGVQGGGSGWPV
jgi:hypothetical protein